LKEKAWVQFFFFLLFIVKIRAICIRLAPVNAFTSFFSFFFRFISSFKGARPFLLSAILPLRIEGVEGFSFSNGLERFCDFLDEHPAVVATGVGAVVGLSLFCLFLPGGPFSDTLFSGTVSLFDSFTPIPPMHTVREALSYLKEEFGLLPTGHPLEMRPVNWVNLVKGRLSIVGDPFPFQPTKNPCDFDMSFLFEAFKHYEFAGGLPDAKVMVLFGFPILFITKILDRTPFPLIKEVLRRRDFRYPLTFHHVDFMNPDNPSSNCKIKFFDDGTMNYPRNAMLHKKSLSVFYYHHSYDLGYTGVGREIVDFTFDYNPKTGKCDFPRPV
jgi:hypothetical protein